MQTGFLWQDMRYALRTARKNRGFVAIAVATLGLGIGANTAVFSVIRAVLLAKPPYADPSRLATLRQRFPRSGETMLGTSQAEYLDYRDRTRAFQSFAGYESAAFDLTGTAEPVRVEALRVTPRLFETLGVSPLAGRTFTPAEGQAGSPHAAIVSYEFWQRHWGGAANLLGTVIRLDEQPYTVVGIMPRGFEFPFTPASVGEPPALWVPLAFTAKELDARVAEFPVRVVARLRDGISWRAAAADVNRVAMEFQREHPDIYTGNLRLEVSLSQLGEESAARMRPVLLTLAGAVLFVLFIACGNVMHLLLARAAARQREMAVRHALGASGGRLLVQWTIEALLLTLAGAVAGCALAQGLLGLLTGTGDPLVSGLAQAHLDTTVLAFTLLLTVVSGVVCGLVPAAGGGRGGALQQGMRHSASREHHRLRSALALLEASSATVLLIGAGLLIHSFVRVLRVPPGFSSSGVLIARTTLNRERYPSSDRRREAARLMAERLRALPGVSAVALATHIPLADERQIGFILEGEDVHSGKWADNALVSGDYFSAMGIPLVRGRTFGPQDTPGAPLAAIVNQSMARRFWPDGDAVGKRIVWGGLPLNIVGIAGDVHLNALDAAVNYTIYCPVYQAERGPTSRAVFVIRTATGDPASLARAVRESIWSVDRDLPVFDIRTMDSIVARSLATRRFAAGLLTAFAALALALAVIGLYGVLSYTVVQRRSELGIRLALGATPSQVLRSVLSEGIRLTAIGIAAGAILGGAVARAMSHLLFGIVALDPAAFAIAPAALLAAAVAASTLPARRAARVDPMIALRAE